MLHFVPHHTFTVVDMTSGIPGIGAHTTGVCLTLPYFRIAEFNVCSLVHATSPWRCYNAFFTVQILVNVLMCNGVCVCVCAGFGWKVCKLNWMLHYSSRQATVLGGNPPILTLMRWDKVCLFLSLLLDIELHASILL